jgi:hypothetical protein
MLNMGRIHIEVPTDGQIVEEAISQILDPG